MIKSKFLRRLLWKLHLIKKMCPGDLSYYEEIEDDNRILKRFYKHIKKDLENNNL